MFLVDINLLVRQLLPPSWRDRDIKFILFSLVAPIIKIYNNFREYRSEFNYNLIATPQVLSLDRKIKTINSLTAAGVIDGNNGTLEIYSKDEHRGEVLKLINTYRLVGTTIIFNVI